MQKRGFPIASTVRLLALSGSCALATYAFAQSWPDMPSRLSVTDRPVRLVYEQLGGITVTPRQQNALLYSACYVVIKSPRARDQRVYIAGGKPPLPDCASTLAIGRLGSPMGTYRFAIIVGTVDPKVLLRENSDTPFVVFRTRDNPKWRVDHVLSETLAKAGARSIPNIRRLLTDRRLQQRRIKHTNLTATRKPATPSP